MLIEFEVQMELSIILFNSLLERLEQVMDTVHGERRLAKDTHNLEDRSANLEVMLDDSNEAVGDDGHVYLYADCVFRFSPKSLDLKMLLDPFEKQFHLPPVFIEQGNVLRAEVEVVRIVDEASVKFWCIIDNSGSPHSTHAQRRKERHRGSQSIRWCQEGISYSSSYVYFILRPPKMWLSRNICFFSSVVGSPS